MFNILYIEVKYFCITFTQNCFEMSTKISQDCRKIHILLKTQEPLGSQVGSRPLVSDCKRNDTNFGEQICESAQSLFILKRVFCNVPT